MRRLIAPAIAGLLMLMVLAVPRAKADGGGSGLTFSAPPGMEGGTLQYNGTPTGVLNGIRVPVTQVGLTGGSSDAVSGLSCGSASCGWLQFSTGSLISSGPGRFTFGAGGMVTIQGTVPGQTGPATTLISATFVGPVTVTQISGSTWEMVGSISVTSTSSSIQQLFPNLQLPASGSLSSLVIVFHMRPNGTFSGTSESTNMFVSTAPEASSLILLGSGLIGVGSILRRRKRDKPTEDTKA
jgi:hypothetical protein